MDTSDLFVPVILGTAREGRRSENVAKYVLGEVEKTGVQTELIDVRDHLLEATIPSWEEDTRAAPWRELAARADGFVIVSPEYNRGIPGELKLLLDRAFKEYAHKPVGIVGVSDGPTGGSRMIPALKAVLVTFQLVPLRNEAYFANVKELFDESGAITDDSLGERVEGLMDELLWYAGPLKTARESS